MTLTEATDCQSYKIPCFVFLFAFILSLSFNVFVIAKKKIKKAKQRRAYIENGGMVNIGRRRNRSKKNMVLQSYLNNNNNKNVNNYKDRPSLQALHQENPFPVIPTINIIRDDDSTGASIPEETYEQIFRNGMETLSIPNPISAVPSGEYADLVPATPYQRQSVTSPIAAQAASTPRLDQTNAESAQSQSEYEHYCNVAVKNVRSSKEMIETGKDISTEEVFAKDESNAIKVFLTSALRSVPQRISSTLSSIGASFQQPSPSPLSNSPSQATLYLSFPESGSLKATK